MEKELTAISIEPTTSESRGIRSDHQVFLCFLLILRVLSLFLPKLHSLASIVLHLLEGHDLGNTTVR